MELGFEDNKYCNIILKSTVYFEMWIRLYVYFILYSVFSIFNKCIMLNTITEN